MSTKQNDENFENITEWLDERGVTASDVKSDTGGKYVEYDTEDGNTKEYLPDSFQDLV